ncbi:hypothetical protein X798_04587 [Onchocerca flexuosa]|uniref:Uncharacterized protein n=1 Tax=Onchocerca flexuosa TaxID=387005 RepID=A0A238BSQ3_9BILA|nr:hypothetical protein X798_04587 [Onchocerca flexuosa]
MNDTSFPIENTNENTLTTKDTSSPTTENTYEDTLMTRNTSSTDNTYESTLTTKDTSSPTTENTYESKNTREFFFTVMVENSNVSETKKKIPTIFLYNFNISNISVMIDSLREINLKNDSSSSN